MMSNMSTEGKKITSEIERENKTPLSTKEILAGLSNVMNARKIDKTRKEIQRQLILAKEKKQSISFEL